jgi:hypothetical protein
VSDVVDTRCRVGSVLVTNYSECVQLSTRVEFGFVSALYDNGSCTELQHAQAETSSPKVFTVATHCSEPAVADHFLCHGA